MFSNSSSTGRTVSLLRLLTSLCRTSPTRVRRWSTRIAAPEMPPQSAPDSGQSSSATYRAISSERARLAGLILPPPWKGLWACCAS